MGKYGQAAVKAVKLIRNNLADTPNEAWEKATIEIFGEGTSSQSKGCPKNTFLGLCQEGLIKGINVGEYTKSYLNKNYAVKALKILRIDPSLAKDQSSLWMEVIDGINKKHNCQMDVVISLWNEELIEEGENNA